MSRPHAHTLISQLQRVGVRQVGRLWRAAAPQRVAAIRRDDLRLEQYRVCGDRRPQQVPRVNAEFESTALRTARAGR